jgi:hypothetical protein
LASAATAGAVGIVNAPIASAEDATTSSIGTQAKLVDGNVIQVNDQQPQDKFGSDSLSGKWHAVGSHGNPRSPPEQRHPVCFEPQRPFEERPDIPGTIPGGDAARSQPGDSRARRIDQRQSLLRRHRRQPGQRGVQRRRRPGSANLGAGTADRTPGHPLSLAQLHDTQPRGQPNRACAGGYPGRTCSRGRLPGQFTTLKAPTMASKVPPSAALSRTNVYVDDSGPPGSEFFSQLSFASASFRSAAGLQAPEG